MRRLILVFMLVLVALVGNLDAQDFRARRPAKPPTVLRSPAPDAARIRQGGDTVLDPVPLAVPGTAAGTTVGYTDDYDEVCPYTGSTSPDVVYVLEPAADILVDIDMAGSSYDTKIYVYNADLDLLACNDDFYFDYTSKLEEVQLTAGESFFLVIDGYGGEAGNYVVGIVEREPCEIDLLWYSWHEQEPPLIDGYVDAYNGGCNSPEFGNPIILLYPLESWFCGTSGWYTANGEVVRDTDWYEVFTNWYTGDLSITAIAERPTYLFHVAPQDCGSVAVVQVVDLEPCVAMNLSIPDEDAGDTVWLVLMPRFLEGPLGAYDYGVMCNLPVATEQRSWSSLKALFD